MKFTHLYLNFCQEKSTGFFSSQDSFYSTRSIIRNLQFGSVQPLWFPSLDFSLLHILSYLFLYPVSLSEWILLIKTLYGRKENIDPETWQRENEYNKGLIWIKEGYTDLQGTLMQTWGFLYIVGRKLEINRCLNFFWNFGKLYSLLKLWGKKECLEFLALLILFSVSSQSCSHAFSSDQVSGLKKKKDKTQKPRNTSPLLPSLILNSDTKPSFITDCTTSA